jgi:hypothetical protein
MGYWWCVNHDDVKGPLSVVFSENFPVDLMNMLKISLNSESEYINIYYYTIFLYILFFSDINVCSYSFRGDFSNFENLFENVTFEKYS